MLFVFMGPSCTGKSSVAEEIKKDMDIEVYAGKDYLRMAKNENDAWKIFIEKLADASENKEAAAKSIIYLVTEKDILSKIQFIKNAIFVKFTADNAIVKSRFSARMKGNLPKHIEAMIERQMKDWENENGMLQVDTTTGQPLEHAKKLLDAI